MGLGVATICYIIGFVAIFAAFGWILRGKA